MSVAEKRREVELTPDEAALAARIEFDASELLRLDFQDRIANGERVLELTRSLAGRGAIPPHRLKYFTDPEFYPGGRKKSLQQIYEGNGTSGDDIPRHPHFLRVARYFLTGPDLPAAAKDAFARAVQSAGGEITGSEVNDVSKAARQIARTHRLEPHAAAEEFFKLALEHGAHPMWAKMVYESVRTVRYTR